MTPVPDGIPPVVIDPAQGVDGQADGPAEPSGGLVRPSRSRRPNRSMLSADPMEVVGRLSIAGRRGPANGNFPEDRIPVGEGVELDRRARAIRRDGRLASLRPRELALLEFLAMHPGRSFSREELSKHVWHGVGPMSGWLTYTSTGCGPRSSWTRPTPPIW